MKQFLLNLNEWTSIAKGAVVAIAGALLVYGQEYITGAEIPADVKPLIVAAWSVFANYVRKTIAYANQS